MSTQLRVLIVEDGQEEAARLAELLRRGGLNPAWEQAATEPDYLARLGPGQDLVLSEYRLSQFSGPEALRLLRARDPDVPFILVAGGVADEVAAALLQQGADDYLLKDRLARLGPAVRAALERRRAEGAAARLAALASGSDTALVATDMGGAVTAWNRGAERLYGHTAAEMLGRPVTVLTPPERQGEARLLLEQLRRGEDIGAFDTVRLHKGGAALDVSLSAAPVRDRRGRVVGTSELAYGITERRRLEEQLRQSQKMEAVGRLAGGVAHDFNNLLQVITGYGSLLLDHLAQGDPNRELVREMAEAGDKAALLTRQLLAFSRQQITTPQVLDLRAVVGDAEKMLRRIIGEDVQLVSVSDPDLGSVRADAGQVLQVLMNLAVNSRDAMPTGGQLTVETRNVELDESYPRTHAGVRPGSYVLLAVSDTGLGMDRATLARIWEPFFTTKGPGVGTGLGLAVVHGILQQAGGHAQVYSEPGHGTTFKLYFPRLDVRPSGGKSSPGLKVLPRGTETVLLVEDEEVVRTLIRHVLEDCGYALLEARDADEALRLVGQHAGGIHLLVTDVVMPRTSGRELAERLTVLRPAVKILYLSGYTDDAVVRHGVLSREVDFLQKPFSATALAQKVRGVLDGQG